METRNARHRGTLDGASLAMGEKLTAVTADAEGSQHAHQSTEAGGMWLTCYVSPAEWAVLAPLVAARAPDLPLVSQLDTAGMRACLRDAAVAAAGETP